jgi:uncharacterized Ntn-hydrolase superfamily protein
VSPDQAIRDQLRVDTSGSSATDEHQVFIDEHQILIIDARGETAALTGRACAPSFGQIQALDHVTAGVGMASANVIGTMSLSFERSGGFPFWIRLLLALESGVRAGGDRGGTRSAALIVLGAEAGVEVDTRVDKHRDPVEELRRRLSFWHAQKL